MMLAAAPAMTIAVAVPETPPAVAVTVLVTGVVPAVNTPAWVMVVPPPPAVDQVGLMPTTVPLAS
ncbi:MAG: hypothetical protein ABR998_14830 [Gemmatimonadales bacterium]